MRGGQYMYADLHLHTNYSDGKLSVSDTIKIANIKGINTLSITDHDSVAGVKEAILQSKLLGMNCISGLELSCRNENIQISFPDDISIHLLAYNINYQNRQLLSYLEYYHMKRKEILLSLIEELINEGFDVKYGDIYIISGTQMRIQDVINHINSSFIYKEKREYFLAIANSYYKRLFSIDCTLENAIELIKGAGGMPVLAHAFFSYRDYDIIKNDQKNVYALLNYLCELGIQGIEVFYSRFSENQTKWLLQEAKKRNLAITAGSDFHGTSSRKDMINYEIAEIADTIRNLLEGNKY